MYKVVFALWALLTLSQHAAGNEHVKDYVPNAEPVGAGRLNFLVWSIYDAVLYAPGGKWSETQPFALTLTYLRAVEGKDIADRSIKEIRGQGYPDEVKLADWHAQLLKIIPDVAKHNSLTGVVTREGETFFYKGEAALGSVTDPEFSERFFRIWLGEKTSEPELRRQLLGLK